MNKELLLAEVFGQFWTAKSGNKYVVHWCELCDCAMISCKECTGTTCNCHSCEKCTDDQNEFNGFCVNVEDYLTEEEQKVYWKCREIKKFIIETITEGQQKIDFKKIEKDGRLSKNTKKMFKNELL